MREVVRGQMLRRPRRCRVIESVRGGLGRVACEDADGDGDGMEEALRGSTCTYNIWPAGRHAKTGCGMGMGMDGKERQGRGTAGAWVGRRRERERKRERKRKRGHSVPERRELDSNTGVWSLDSSSASLFPLGRRVRISCALVAPGPQRVRQGGGAGVQARTSSRPPRRDTRSRWGPTDASEETSVGSCAKAMSRLWCRCRCKQRASLGIGMGSGLMASSAL
ncbi:hypothetical protein B0H17DRAFT_704058 [Mycena rosella]|uniref:Uncharacterized protein n=1 Tax=Mycena rosella TaxID=1033263 RepID=A0AAD7GGD0_MYCRO|nr:hypothetical protein B0H17DRAFT_704058 [Mycena rosella]